MANCYHSGKRSFLVALILYSSLCFAQVEEKWTKRFNGAENGFDYTYDMAVDALGNIYVTGVVGQGTVDNYATIKYDAAGNMKWVRRFNGPGNEVDQPTSLAVDNKGNVYVTGYSVGIGGTWDYATIKYDAAGNELWVRWYDGPAFSSDIATSLAVDDQGNVYVTGYSDGNETSSDMATIKYDTNGNELWIRWYDGPGHNSDIAIALVVDASGNVYVTGSSMVNSNDFTYDYTTIKYNSAGTQLWVKRYNGPAGGNEIPSSIAVDNFGNVYVTGESLGNNGVADYATVKYDSKGTEQWVRRQEDGNAYSLAVDALGNVFVTGVMHSGDTGGDFGTIKYNTTGTPLWVKRYNGPGNNSDVAVSMAVDSFGNVYVTGSSFGTSTFSDIATIKYDPIGNTVWTQRYNGPANGDDAAVAVVVDSKLNVYVSGHGFGVGTETDYVTIKYFQTTVRNISCGNGGKILVCHKGTTHCISRSAVDAHLKHGDQLGNCTASSDLNSVTASNDAPSLNEERSGSFKVSVAPNPFNTSTKLYYELPSDGEVSVRLFDVVGRELATLVQAKQKAGWYYTGFSSATLNKGIYYYYALFTNAQKKVYAQTGKVIVDK